ncbi:unnamed protein product [Owenia fusiformis]|uniref:C2H2-type domain-containing protein n=1 Tax=Owenia fusiformis TaxID=6347 RepID=A0A8S4NCQ0_OWEFU|nr:unnamed protein product [Owenia fusiformis]
MSFARIRNRTMSFAQQSRKRTGTPQPRKPNTPGPSTSTDTEDSAIKTKVNLEYPKLILNLRCPVCRVTFEELAMFEFHKSLHRGLHVYSVQIPENVNEASPGTANRSNFLPPPTMSCTRSGQQQLVTRPDESASVLDGMPSIGGIGKGKVQIPENVNEASPGTANRSNFLPPPTTSCTRSGQQQFVIRPDESPSVLDGMPSIGGIGKGKDFPDFEHILIMKNTKMGWNYVSYSEDYTKDVQANGSINITSNKFELIRGHVKTSNKTKTGPTTSGLTVQIPENVNEASPGTANRSNFLPPPTTSCTRSGKQKLVIRPDESPSVLDGMPSIGGIGKGKVQIPENVNEASPGTANRSKFLPPPTTSCTRSGQQQLGTRPDESPSVLDGMPSIGGIGKGKDFPDFEHILIMKNTKMGWNYVSYSEDYKKDVQANGSINITSNKFELIRGHVKTSNKTKTGPTTSGVTVQISENVNEASPGTANRSNFLPPPTTSCTRSGQQELVTRPDESPSVLDGMPSIGGIGKGKGTITTWKKKCVTVRYLSSLGGVAAKGVAAKDVVERIMAATFTTPLATQYD